MQEPRTFWKELIDRAVTVVAAGAALLSLLILLFNMLTHFPFFDESVHIHYLWMFSQGLRPGTDFFCIYPVLGYLLTLPFLRMFPESAFVVLALRSFSVVIVVLIGMVFYHHGRRVSRDWTLTVLAFLLIVKASALGPFLAEYSIDHLAALAAMSACLLFFGDATFRLLALASALSLLSVAITPKYPLPLLFGLLGFAGACWLRTRRIGGTLAAVAAGGISTGAAVALLYWATGTSLAENIRHSFLLQLRLRAALGDFGWTGRPLLAAVLGFFKRNPAAGIVIALGIAGWAKRSWRNPDAAALSGAGILLGALLNSFLIRDFHSQYVAPMLFCLVLFTPYALSLVRTEWSALTLRFAFAVAAVVTLTFHIGTVAQNFDEVPVNMRGVTPTQTRYLGRPLMAPIGIQALSDYDDLLDIIPSTERVAAVWPFHPIFRRDQTAIAIDEKPGYEFLLSPDDPARKEFDPRAFRASLERHPPALIAPLKMEQNYPPGWREQAEEFLRSHGGWYVQRRTRLFQYFIRRDLVGPGGSPALQGP